MAKSDDPIQELERIVHSLPSLTAYEDPTGGLMEFDVAIGTALGFGIFKNKDVATACFFASKGSSFEMHTHEVTEYNLTVRGSYTLMTPGKETLIEAPHLNVFWPMEPHGIVAVHSDLEIIAITIPASTGYPESENME